MWAKESNEELEPVGTTTTTTRGIRLRHRHVGDHADDLAAAWEREGENVVEEGERAAATVDGPA